MAVVTSDIFLLKSLLKFVKRLRINLKKSKTQDKYSFLIVVIRTCGILNKLLCKFNVGDKIYFLMDKKLNKKILVLDKTNLESQLLLCYKSELRLTDRLIVSIKEEIKRVNKIK